MADPLSIAASIAGLTTFIAQVSCLVRRYRSNFKDQASDLESTKKKIEQLRPILDDLDEQFVELECSSSQPLDATTIARVDSLIKSCSEHKDTLEKRFAEIFGNDVTAQVSGSTQRNPAAIRGMDARLAGVRDTFRRFTYPIRRGKLLSISSEIDQIFTKASLALQLLMRRHEARAESKIDDVQATVVQMKNLQMRTEDIQKISELRKWLKAPEPSEDYQRLASQAHPSTGSWLINGDAFKSWEADNNSFLWLRGFAGCGKSVICSTCITHLLDVRDSAPLEVGVAYFFFTFADDAKQDAAAMLRSLVLQLSQQMQDYSLLSHLHSECNDRPPTNDKLKGCLKSLIQKYQRVFITIDALDESPRHINRDEVLVTLSDIRNWLMDDLHILVTSRDEEDIRYGLDFSDQACNKLGYEVIPMQNESVDEDIANYIREQLAKASSLRKLRPFHTQIEEFLSSHSNGVFRWVEFQLLALKSCPRSQHHVSKFLKSLPPTLDATYERILTGIDETIQEDSKRLLSILCCAVRPMNVEQLLDALAVDIGPEPGFNKLGRLYGEADLRSMCPGMIEMYPISWLSRDPFVRLAHFSVKEYLVSDRIKQHDSSYFHVSIPKAHSDMARVCLHYLMDPNIIQAIRSPVHASCILDEQSDISSSSSDMGLGITYGADSRAPLMEYGVRFWPEHYRKAADGDQTGQLCDLVIQFFFRLPAFHTWRDQLNYDVLTVDFEQKAEKWPNHVPGSPLYYLAGLGLYPVLKSLLGSGSNHQELVPQPRSLVNQVGGEREYPLHAAALGGHREVVQLLLEGGARADAMSDVHIRTTALISAAESGDAEIVQLLIGSGANVNRLTRGPYRTALIAASHNGAVEAIKLLLSSGADVNCYGGWRYGTALMAASENGAVGAVKLLLDAGAKVNMFVESRFGTALIAASANGSVGAIKLLLENGANVNMCRGGLTDETALIAASYLGNVEAIQLLLDSGADINRDTEGGNRTPLMAACYRGRTQAVRLLLDQGADANTTFMGRTALNEAADGTYDIDIVVMLLEAGADVNAQSPRSGSALMALVKGRPVINPAEEMTDAERFRVGVILLEKGADINARMKSGETALELAEKYGDSVFVEWLLNHGAAPTLCPISTV